MNRPIGKIGRDARGVKRLPREFPEGCRKLPTRLRIIPLLVLASMFLLSGTVRAASEETQTGASAPGNSPPTIVIFFVGGFFHHNPHRPDMLAQKLSVAYGDRIRFVKIDNRRIEDAHQVVLKELGVQGGAEPSDAEKQKARIILLGHSWGGPALLNFARALEKDNIPVLLTVEIDSINKSGQDDRVIPANVAKAINYYQTRGILHGTKEITAADPTRTEILGNFRYKYNRVPRDCHDYPSIYHVIFTAHVAIECDLQIWSQIESYIDADMAGGTDQVQKQN